MGAHCADDGYERAAKTAVTLRQEEGELFRLFEEEMGRLLSPLELEK